MTIELRPAHAVDLPNLYGICHATSGGADPIPPKVLEANLVGHLFAAPYLFFEPELCLVAHDGPLLLGYLVGTSRTPDFAQWMERDWLPQVRRQHPLRSGESRFESWLLETIHHPEPLPACAASHPAHLHINLLPQARRTGTGRALMHTFEGLLDPSKTRGIHLGVSASNLDAIAFYHSLGYRRLASGSPDDYWMTKDLGREVASKSTFAGLGLHSGFTSLPLVDEDS